MTKKKVTTPTTGAGSELTAERIRAILSDPNAGERVTLRLQSLVNRLGEATDAPAPESPDFYAHAFAYGADKLRRGAVARLEVDDAREAVEQIARLAERHEPKALKVARRCREIYEAAGGNGAYHFAEHVDAVLEGGADGLIPNPDSKYFTPLFVEAFNARGPRDRKVRELLDLIKRVDEGADLNALYDEAKREEADRQERLRVADLAKPEPKDTLSDEWRYWKIRHLGAALQGGDAAAWGEFWRYLDAFKNAALSGETYTATVYTAARQMLPDLLIFSQKNATGKRPKREGKDARLVRRLSAILADDARGEDHDAILVALCDLHNDLRALDTDPEIFPTMMRALMTKARQTGEGLDCLATLEAIAAGR